MTPSHSHSHSHGTDLRTDSLSTPVQWHPGAELTVAREELPTELRLITYTHVITCTRDGIADSEMATSEAHAIAIIRALAKELWDISPQYVDIDLDTCGRELLFDIYTDADPTANNHIEISTLAQPITAVLNTTIDEIIEARPYVHTLTEGNYHGLCTWCKRGIEHTDESHYKSIKLKEQPFQR